jgi:D-alanyl-D-alanine carboxypeptidase/D-alanyl-D-alanine-endopeptidase (penicillin-binding protein 4)
MQNIIAQLKIGQKHYDVHSPDTTILFTHYSPSLDSIIYWFLKKSINFYGEALVRTIGMEKKGFGSTEKGLEWIDSFYTANGFDTDAFHVYDGSGLSPANRVTPSAMAGALYFAKSRSWFPSFYDALPVYNGMKLKSGTIGHVKCYAGYHTSKAGKQYVVTFMVNNYNGSPSALVNKMFIVLDNLK